MRLSSSFNGISKGELAPLALGLEYFDKLVLLASGVLFGGGVRVFFDVVIIADFVDFGVGVSMISKPKGCCLWLLYWGHGLGLGFISETALGGVSWKLFMIWLSGGFYAEGS